MSNILASAWTDICGGYRLRRVWITLASEDIGDQHRRTTLGPLWLLINYLAFAGTFIFVFNGSTPTPGYIVYVATGLVVWFYIMEVITVGIGLFAREESFIKGTTLPLSVYVMRAALQSIIRAGYALAGCAIILTFAGVGVSFSWLWSLVGLGIVLLATPPTLAVFAFTGVYFPDSQFVISNLMRVAMFITPVFWVHGGEGGIRGLLYVWNPFTYFLEGVRAPIVEGRVPLEAFGVSLLIVAGLWALAIALLGALRRDVALVI